MFLFIRIPLQRIVNKEELPQKWNETNSSGNWRNKQ